MLFQSITSIATAFLLALPTTTALFRPGPKRPAARSSHNKVVRDNHHFKRQYYPANATDVKSFTTPTNVTIRYKEPGKEGVCETTPGVNSYSGYIDLAANVHVFFWFFESRSDPKNDPLTLWLNGGPGSDSLIGLFDELGPCRITENLTSVINPWSFNNVSNMLFISQPVGVGFSYQDIATGSEDNYTAGYLNSSQAPPTALFPTLDPVDLGTIDTTDLAAVAAWHVLQGFLSGLPQLDAKLGCYSKDFNLWTESYGGHYGPSFYNYFQTQNEKILSNKLPGYALKFVSLGIGNGIIDEAVQAEHYPEFAVNNTYGITAYNDTVYSYAKFANNMVGGCLAQIENCRLAAASFNGGTTDNGSVITYAATSNPSFDTLCSEAGDMCRDNVEGMYYNYGGRGVYDIRHPYADPTPPSYFPDYLNIASVQNALGVSINYSSTDDIYWAFQATGDFIYSNFLTDLEHVLERGVRVSLFYGDADYICNWFGGEAISLALDYKHKAEFAKAGYEPFVYNGIEYGEVRQYGNFSFLRVYESGHEVPYYQPQAALALFNRTINLASLADGNPVWTNTSATHGKANATHTAPFPSLPATNSASLAAYSASLVSYYDALDTMTPSASATP